MLVSSDLLLFFVDLIHEYYPFNRYDQLKSSFEDLTDYAYAFELERNQYSTGKNKYNG
jgi:hypothetical protein